MEKLWWAYYFPIQMIFHLQHEPNQRLSRLFFDNSSDNSKR